MSDLEKVLLVHGTHFSSVDVVNGALLRPPWWRLDSIVWIEFARRLPTSISLQSFQWSGANREYDRRRAGSKLLEVLLDFERKKSGYHIVAHSHGGSVLWNALVEAAWLYERENNDEKKRTLSLPGLRSWTTVGTPFLTYRLKGHRARLLISLVCFTVVHVLLYSAVLHEGPLKSTFLILPRVLRPLIVSVIVSWFSYEAFANISAGDIHGTTAHFYESAMKRYGTRWLGVWSRFDEALAGLSSTLQELNVKWIPNTLFRRRTWPWGPEWAHLAIFHVILFANGIARLVAPFGDRLISRFLLRTAQGNDLPGSFVLQGVTHTPIGLVAGGPDLPEDVEGELIDSANRRAAALIPNARQVFCQLALEGVAIAQTLQASGLALAEGSLVHTSYFENEQILDLIGMHVARHSLLDRGEKVPFRPIKLEQWFNEWQRHIETVISRLP